MAVALRVAVAAGLMLFAAAIVYVLTSGHVFFLPFILVLGLPLIGLFRQPPNRPPPAQPYSN